MMEPDAAPAGVRVRSSRLREAPGSRPSLLRGTALRWPGRGADEGGRKPAGSGAQPGPVRVRKLRPRGQKSPHGAPRGARVLDEGTRLDGRLVRRLARQPLTLCGGRKREYGVPGAEKNTGAGACPRLFDN